MLKTVLVPLVELAEPRVASFLELWVEPATAGGGDGLEALAFGPLKAAVAGARLALAGLPVPVRPAVTRLMTANMALTGSAGAALALALCPHLLDPAFPYFHLIITGTLDFGSLPGGAVTLGDSGHIRRKLEAVRDLGQQREPMLLLLPRPAVKPELAGLLGELAGLNIAVRQASTLAEALDACTGRLAKGAIHGAD